MNPYSNLICDTKSVLPQPWYDYPVLKAYESIDVYRQGRSERITIKIGQQDGRWVASYDFWLGQEGGGSNPGRKWGDFNTRCDAMLYTLGKLREMFGVRYPQVRLALSQTINAELEPYKQPTLFN